MLKIIIEIFLKELKSLFNDDAIKMRSTYGKCKELLESVLEVYTPSWVYNEDLKRCAMQIKKKIDDSTINAGEKRQIANKLHKMTELTEFSCQNWLNIQQMTAYFEDRIKQLTPSKQLRSIFKVLRNGFLGFAFFYSLFAIIFLSLRFTATYHLKSVYLKELQILNGFWGYVIYSVVLVISLSIGIYLNSKNKKNIDDYWQDNINF